MTINNSFFFSPPRPKTQFPLSTIRILVTRPALMISSSLSGDRWVLSLWVPLHTVTFLSAHQSLVSSFFSPTPRLLPFSIPPAAGYRCAEFFLVKKKKPKNAADCKRNKHSSPHYRSFIPPSLPLSAPFPCSDGIIRLPSLTLMSNSLSSLVPSPPRPALRRPPHPFLNPPRDRPCNPIKSTLGPNE